MQRGLLIDGFESHRQGRALVCLVGRLESGETFGVLDVAPQPRLFVRSSDAKRVQVPLSPTPLKTMDGELLMRAVASHGQALRRLDRELQGRGIRTYDAETDAVKVYLQERGLRRTFAIDGAFRTSDFLDRVYEAPILSPADANVSPTVLSFDIETTGTHDRVLAFSLVLWGGEGTEPVEEVHVAGSGVDAEAKLLDLFIRRVRELDPDVLTGWNVIDFDFKVLMRRFEHCGKHPLLGRSRDQSTFKDGKGFFTGSRVLVPGRQVVDALRLVRALPGSFDDLRLGTVATAIVGRGKTIVAEEWEDIPDLLEHKYRDDPDAFAEYCLEDARLVRDILVKERLIELSVSRSKLTGQPLDRAWGSVAAFDNLYSMELFRRGIVGPSHGVDVGGEQHAPGGLVMEPKSGLYRNIFVFDFKSLYPSIMRTFNIDPLAHAQARNLGDESLIVAPNGAAFNRERGILPTILDEFTASRELAKKHGDEVGSYVYKILLNSFYGVLGTDSCRFASGAMAGAITSFGHSVLRWMRSYFEAQGFEVLYGDTDSLFVDAKLMDGVEVGEAISYAGELCVAANQALADYVRATYGVSSVLDLEFDTFYRWLLLPSVRGGGAGRAKSYAGLSETMRGQETEIKGMEAVRGDWTQVARLLQRQLLALIFQGATAKELEHCFHLTIADVRSGKRDDDLVYRKSIRKPLKEYGNNAPHVRAAALLPKPVRVVRYLITREGPQPLGFVKAPIDYEHYIQKQLLPIAQGLAEFGGFRASLADDRNSLFGD